MYRRKMKEFNLKFRKKRNRQFILDVANTLLEGLELSTRVRFVKSYFEAFNVANKKPPNPPNIASQPPGRPPRLPSLDPSPYPHKRKRSSSPIDHRSTPYEHHTLRRSLSTDCPPPRSPARRRTPLPPDLPPLRSPARDHSPHESPSTDSSDSAHSESPQFRPRPLSYPRRCPVTDRAKESLHRFSPPLASRAPGDPSSPRSSSPDSHLSPSRRCTPLSPDLSPLRSLAPGDPSSPRSRLPNSSFSPARRHTPLSPDLSPLRPPARDHSPHKSPSTHSSDSSSSESPPQFRPRPLSYPRRCPIIDWAKESLHRLSPPLASRAPGDPSSPRSSSPDSSLSPEISEIKSTNSDIEKLDAEISSTRKLIVGSIAKILCDHKLIEPATLGLLDYRFLTLSRMPTPEYPLSRNQLKTSFDQKLEVFDEVAPFKDGFEKILVVAATRFIDFSELQVVKDGNRFYLDFSTTESFRLEHYDTLRGKLEELQTKKKTLVEKLKRLMNEDQSVET